MKKEYKKAQTQETNKNEVEYAKNILHEWTMADTSAPSGVLKIRRTRDKNSDMERLQHAYE